jgi:hypothetical protein
MSTNMINKDEYRALVNENAELISKLEVVEDVYGILDALIGELELGAGDGVGGLSSESSDIGPSRPNGDYGFKIGPGIRPGSGHKSGHTNGHTNGHTRGHTRGHTSGHIGEISGHHAAQDHEPEHDPSLGLCVLYKVSVQSDLI